MAAILSGTSQNGQTENGIQVARFPIGQYNSDNNPFNAINVENTDEPITKNNLSELVKAMTDGWSKFTERISDESKNLVTDSSETISDNTTEKTDNEVTEDKTTVSENDIETHNSGQKELDSSFPTMLDKTESIAQDFLSSISSINDNINSVSSSFEGIVSPEINTSIADTLASVSNESEGVINAQSDINSEIQEYTQEPIIQAPINNLESDIFDVKTQTSSPSLYDDITINQDTIRASSTQTVDEEMLSKSNDSDYKDEFSIDDIYAILENNPGTIQTNDAELNMQIADLAKLGPTMQNEIRLMIEKSLQSGTKITGVRGDDGIIQTVSDDAYHADYRIDDFNTSNDSKVDNQSIIDTEKIVDSLSASISNGNFNKLESESIINTGEVQKFNFEQDSNTFEDRVSKVEINAGAIPTIEGNIIKHQNDETNVEDTGSLLNSIKHDNDNNGNIVETLSRIESSLNSGFSEMRDGFTHCFDYKSNVSEKKETYNENESYVSQNDDNDTNNNFTQERIG